MYTETVPEHIESSENACSPSGQRNNGLLISFPFSSHPIRSLELDLTNRCPLRCDYCFRRDLGEFSMEEETAFDCIDWLLRSSMTVKRLRIELFGGEPLCEFPLIRKMVPYAKAKAGQLGKRIHFGCTTNAVLITDQIMDFWAKYHLGFHTSIDGIPEVHDAHRKFKSGMGTSSIIAKNVKKILSYRPWVAARATICPDAVDFIGESLTYFERLGYINVEMCLAEGAVWDSASLEKYRKGCNDIGEFLYEKFRRGEKFRVGNFDKAMEARLSPRRRTAHCGAARGMLHVSHEGELWPCHRWKGGDLEGEWCIGSIYGPFNDVIRDNLLAFSLEEDLLEDCDSCVARPFCGSQCLSANLFQTGSIYKPYQVYCEARRIIFQAASQLAERLEKEDNMLYRKVYVDKTESLLHSTKV